MLPAPQSGFCWGWTDHFPTNCWILYNSDLHWQLHVCRPLGTRLKSVQYVVILLNASLWRFVMFFMAKCKLSMVDLKGRSWIVKRSYEDFRVLDKHLHLCIYDRRFSQLPELPRLDSLTDQSEVRSCKFITWNVFWGAFNFSSFISTLFPFKQVHF